MTLLCHFFWHRRVVFEASSQRDCVGHSCGSVPARSPQGSSVLLRVVYLCLGLRQSNVTILSGMIVILLACWVCQDLLSHTFFSQFCYVVTCRFSRACVGGECDLTCTAAHDSADSWTPVLLTNSGLSTLQLWLPLLMRLNLTLFIIWPLGFFF